MLTYFQYKRSVHKLRRRQLKFSKELKKVNENATSIDDHAEASMIFQEEIKVINRIKYIQTEYYKDLCENLAIPSPDREDKNLYFQFNFDDEEGEKLIFTVLGFQYVRKLIREERKEKREIFGFWATIITGIIGALIGLLSIIKSN